MVKPFHLPSAVDDLKSEGADPSFRSQMFLCRRRGSGLGIESRLGGRALRLTETTERQTMSSN
jgi:hypothetical protein